jgi:hypothetical protein
VALTSALARKKEQPDPLVAGPQLEEQRAEVMGRHYTALLELLQLVRMQWGGVRARGALELAMREAEMQVGGAARRLGEEAGGWLEVTEAQLGENCGCGIRLAGASLHTPASPYSPPAAARCARSRASATSTRRRSRS